MIFDRDIWPDSILSLRMKSSQVGTNRSFKSLIAISDYDEQNPQRLTGQEQ